VKNRAGAVRAMELDINTEWGSFMTYDSIRDPINPGLRNRSARSGAKG
jgi:hypothetical protein